MDSSGSMTMVNVICYHRRQRKGTSGKYALFLWRSAKCGVATWPHEWVGRLGTRLDFLLRPRARKERWRDASIASKDAVSLRRRISHNPLAQEDERTFCACSEKAIAKFIAVCPQLSNILLWGNVSVLAAECVSLKRSRMLTTVPRVTIRSSGLVARGSAVST